MPETITQELQRLISNLDNEANDLARQQALVESNKATMEQMLAERSGVETPPTNGDALPSTDERGLGVSERKLDQVESYLIAHPEATNGQIAKAVKINSGSVSVALKRLREEGKVQIVRKEGRVVTYAYAA
jgi:DNA-binding transcriptional ArsR family regulator